MEVKEMLETMLWVVVDGLAAIWILRMLVDIMTNGMLAGALLLMAEALCG